MSFKSVVVLLCALALPISAVINTKTENKIERREVPIEHKPFDTYGLPPVIQQPILPTAVYGAPAVAKYPSLPPERPPAPSPEYGVPVLKYGPPKVRVEYGPSSAAHSVQQISGNHHHHHQVINHGQNSLSFFDQIKQTFGFGSEPSYPSHHKPHLSYGPPSAPVDHFLPPKPHSQYGPPTKAHFSIPKPPVVYGAPQKTHFPAPKPVYGLPNKPAINFKPPQQIFGPPQQSYGPPHQSHGQQQQSFGPPQQSHGQLQHNFGPPQQSHGQPPHSFGPPQLNYGPPQPNANGPSFPNHGAGCHGWKPIPGPSIESQAFVHSNHAASIHSVVPENIYLPPVSNELNLPGTHLQVQSLPTSLQLPNADASNFNHGTILEHISDSGLGLTNINVIKSEGIELNGNSIADTYSAPPADSFAPNHPRRPQFGLTPPNSFSYPQSHSSGNQLGPSPGYFKQIPLTGYLNPPNRQPVRFRAPVPAGLIESIGQNVLHQDNFGAKFNQHSHNQVYLAPPTNEIPPPPPGLESLPLASAAPFHSHQSSKANSFVDQYIYTPSQCSHGPNLGHNINLFQSIPQLQTVYGIPPQPLDVSYSSGYENAAQAGIVHSSYEAPASGVASSIDTLIDTHEVHAPSSSYGPPPSGNPADSFAHGSQKSISTVQTDSFNSTSNASETSLFTGKTDELPGLSSAGLDIISATKSHSIEIPVQGQHGSYSLQFQAVDSLASQNNELDQPNHEKLISQGLLDQILTAIEADKSTHTPQLAQSNQNENIQNHPDVREFVSSSVGQETLSEVKAE